MNLKQAEWNDSYRSKQNYLFYPNEELIRFINKYIKKRVDIDEYTYISDRSRCLDLGCGIGRHIIYLYDLGFDVYGIDISTEAIDFASKWFDYLGKGKLTDKLYTGSTAKLPYADNFFGFVVSHGVLDSMDFETSKSSVNEVHRTLKNDGLFYFDVISGDDYKHFREYEGEETVINEHEKGTIQSYFNWNKINLLLNRKFEILDCVLVQRESVISNNKNSRYHVIVKKVN